MDVTGVPSTDFGHRSAIPEAVAALWRSGWHLMPLYSERLGGGAVCPLRREVASREAEMSHRSRVGVLRDRGSRREPSSEAEFVQRALEEPSSEAEIVSRVRGRCEWAARWAPLSPFLSSG